MKSRVPIWLQRPRWRWDFGRFVRRHHRLVTMAGACIVFFTFIVREGFRDIFKEFAGSFETAERHYQLQRQLGEIQVELSRLHTQNSLVVDRLYARDLHQTNETALNNRLETVVAKLKSLELSIDSARGLHDKISDFNDRMASFRALSIIAGVQAQLKAVMEMADKRGPDLESQIEQAEKKTTELENKWDDEARNLLNSEEKQKEGFEDAYIAYSVLGFIFYAIGWALGLLGTWYGIEGTKTEGEA
jgi:hypothetical protein